MAGVSAEFVWHSESSLDGFDAVILPGGFSYGDYLRAGALARFSPIMKAVRDFAAAGRPVLGICNGFQILTEARLLPGALRRNDHQRFRCDIVDVRVERPATAFTGGYTFGEIVQLPIAHADGNYYADDTLLAQLHERNQVVLRYVGGSPNGSVDDIAGICNEAGNVVGMMPHPERAVDALLGSNNGARLFTSLATRAHVIGIAHA